MKNYLYVIVNLTFIFLMSCSTDDNSQNNSSNTEKKLIQFTYQDLEDSQNRLTRNIIYDTNGNIIEMTNDEVGKTSNLYSYNSLNQLTSQENFYYHQPSNTLEFEQKVTYEYTNEKISTINNKNIFYGQDGAIRDEQIINHNITYLNNLIIRETNERFRKTKVEFGLNEKDLITTIKVYINEVLESDFIFSYDSEGNCISGNGSTEGFSLDSKTDNIDLSVTYGSEKKVSFLDFLFLYEILDSTYFESFRELLTKYHGNKYPIEIEWFKYDDYTYKETFINSFDDNGNIESTVLSRIPNLPNYGKYTYKWE